MKIQSGDVINPTRIGDLRLDRHYNTHELEAATRAIEAIGINWRGIISLDIDDDDPAMLHIEYLVQTESS